MSEKLINASNDVETIASELKALVSDMRDANANQKLIWDRLYVMRRDLGYVVADLDTRSK